MTLHRSCTPRARRELRRSRPLELRHSGCTGATAASGDSDTPPWGRTHGIGQPGWPPNTGPYARRTCHGPRNKKPRPTYQEPTPGGRSSPLPRTGPAVAGTQRLRPNQWSNLDTQNRTISGNRVTAHNAHEISFLCKLQHFVQTLAGSSQALMELPRRTSTSFHFRNPSLPLVASPIPHPTSLAPSPTRPAVPVTLPPSHSALGLPLRAPGA